MKKIVYFVQLGNLSYYKIGVTNNLEVRLAGLEQYLPLPLKWITYAERSNAGEIEKAIHRKFCSKRTRGEWFKLNKEDVAFIKNALETLDKSKIRIDLDI